MTKNEIGPDAVADLLIFISRDFHRMFNAFRLVLAFLAGQGESGSIARP